MSRSSATGKLAAVEETPVWLEVNRRPAAGWLKGFVEDLLHGSSSGWRSAGRPVSGKVLIGSGRYRSPRGATPWTSSSGC